MYGGFKKASAENPRLQIYELLRARMDFVLAAFTDFIYNTSGFYLFDKIRTKNPINVILELSF